MNRRQLLLLLGGIAVTLSSVNASIDPPHAIRILRFVAETPPTYKAAIVTLELKDTPADGHRRDIVSVASDGRFHARVFDQRRSPKENWKSFASHYVAYDGATLFNSEVVSASEYTATPWRSFINERTCPVQWRFCPWPILPTLSGWLLESPDLEIVPNSLESQGDFTAQSKSLGLAVALHDDGRLASIAVGDPSAASRDAMVFFHGSDRSTPDEALWIVAAVPGTRVIERRERFRVAEIRAIDPDGPEIRFDPVSLDVSRYDEGTGDLIHPTRGVIGNRHATERAMAESTWQYAARPYAIAGVSGLLLIALVSGLRKLKRSV
jgi:hypothetical protein